METYVQYLFMLAQDITVCRTRKFIWLLVRSESCDLVEFYQPMQSKLRLLCLIVVIYIRPIDTSLVRPSLP